MGIGRGSVFGCLGLREIIKEAIRADYTLFFLTNLDQVAAAGEVIIVSYPRIEGATGFPARMWAVTE